MSVVRVKTAHSEYLIDTDAKTYQRSPGGHAPHQLRYPNEQRPYVEIHGLEVGEQLHITEPDGYWVHSTRVDSIEGAG